MKLVLVSAISLVMVSCGFSSSGKVNPSGGNKPPQTTTTPKKEDKPTTSSSTSRYSACGDAYSLNTAGKTKATYDSSRKGCYSSLSSSTTSYNDTEVGECGCVKGQDLSSQDFSKKNLRGMQFIRTNLTNTNLQGSDLTGAMFESADLISTNMSDVNLSQGTIKYSKLQETNLKGAQLLMFVGDAIAPMTFTANISTNILIDGRTIMRDDLTTVMQTGSYKYSVDVPAGRHLTALNGVPTTLEFNETGTDKISAETILRIKDDLSSLARLNVNYAAIPKFNELFNGNNSQALIKFIDDRINYFTERVPSSTSQVGVVVASNPDLNWLTHYYANVILKAGLEKYTTIYKINNRDVKIDGPRTGIMNVGKGYKLMYSSQLSRVSTLLHEARHSDCHVTPTEAQLQAYFSDDVKIPNCGTSHAKCPTGHDLAGAAACDDKPWGAYSVTYKFAQALSKECKNCSELEKQMMLADLKDAETRLLFSAKKVDDGSIADPLKTYANPPKAPVN